MKHINSVSRYLKLDKGRFTLVGKSLLCRIPESYIEANLAVVDDKVTTVGLMDTIWDGDSTTVLKILGMIVMRPSDITDITIDNVKYKELHFTTGDVVIDNTQLLQDGSISYKLFNMCIAYGKIPYFINYETAAELFDTSAAHTGMKLDFSHSIFELLIAKLSRTTTGEYYRHGKLVGRPVFTKLKDVRVNPDSTSAKLLGSYFDDAVGGALLSPNEHNSEIEDLLRY